MENKKFMKCPMCKEKSFINIKKDFYGFKKISEKKTCAMCGYEFKIDEEIEYLKEQSIFGEDDSAKNFCRDCQHYIMHPLTQICELTKKEVTALDSCLDFKLKKD